ncbi:MAG: alpha-2-macroglobulin family protein [Nannocystaceae bacterium]
MRRAARPRILRTLARTLARAGAATLLLTGCPPRGSGIGEAGGPARPSDARTLATFDPAALGPSLAPERPALPLEVVDFGPEGRTSGARELHVRFNQPVVALGDAPTPAVGLFTVDPPRPGEARWTAPDHLVLRFNDLLPDAHRFTVRLAREVAGPGRPALAAPLEWTFETPRPTVVEADPDPERERFLSGDDDDRWGSSWEDHRRGRPFFLQFSGPIRLDDVRPLLRAQAKPWVGEGPAIDVPIKVRRPTAAEIDDHLYDAPPSECVVVEPRGLWPIGGRITLTLAPGLKGADGPLAGDAWSTAFETHPPLSIAEASCSAAAPCGLEPISLRFVNPIRAREVKKITVSPRPRDLQIEMIDDFDEGGQEVVIAGQFLPDTTYEVHVPESLRDQYGQGIVGGATRKAVFVPKPTLALSAPSGVLSPGLSQTIGVEARHVTEVAVRVGAYSDVELAGLTLFDDRTIADLPAPKKTTERTLRLDPAGKTEWSSTALDLAALAGGSGRPVLVEVRATQASARGRAQGLPEPVRGLYRLTDLGPVSVFSLSSSQVQVLRLSTAQPVPKARIYEADAKAPGGLRLLGEADDHGLVAVPYLDLAERRRERSLVLVVADPVQDDRAIVEVGADVEAPARRRPEWLRTGEHRLVRIVTERGAYRPGERIRVMGWSTIVTPFTRSNLRHPRAGVEVSIALVDRQQRVIARETVRTRADGRFWAPLEIPPEATLGPAYVSVDGTAATAPVAIEDYRVPEFTVDARLERAELLEGEPAVIDVQARYYFGAPTPILRLTRSIECWPTTYRPPGLEERWVVGARARRDGSRWPERIPESLGAAATAGRHRLVVDDDRDRVGAPQRCTAAIAVRDPSNQEAGAEARYLVHPAAYYLAMLPPRRSVAVGETASVLVRAVDPRGERVAAAGVTLKVTRRWKVQKWTTKDGQRIADGWEEREETLPRCVVDLAAAGDDARCAVKVEAEGLYELRAESKEPGSARVATTLTGFRARRPTTTPPKKRGTSAAPERLTVVAEPTAVTPGDTVEILVRGPWPGAQGNLVLARGGLREIHPIRLDGGEARLRFTADDTWTPAVTAEAFVVAPTPAKDAKRGAIRPHVERARAVIEQGHAHRRLRVHVDAPAEASPGAPIELAVRVRDAEDQPTAARVALWAVDEAVLDLTSHTTPDLLPHFIPPARPELDEIDDYRALLRPYVARRTDPWFDEGKTIGLGNTGLIGKGGGGGTGYGRGPEAVVRDRFQTTPIYLADLAVGPSGEAKVRATLRDNLTTFRITAIASAPLVDGSATGRFGQSDARTTVTAPMTVRGALPRHLRPGDRAEIAALVDNLGGGAGRVKVVAKVVEETGSKGHVLKILSKKTADAEIEAGGQARLAFEVEALAAGAPTIELSATFTPADGGAPRVDAVRQPLPIAAERTLRERVAVYGSLADDQAIAIPVQLPREVLPDLGGVQLSLTATLLGDLADAVRSLVEYPHGCAEQTASRLLPLVALGDLRGAVGLEVEDPRAAIQSGVLRLLAMQRESGGFAYWPGDDAANDYVSAYATWVLGLAAASGREVDLSALSEARDFLQRRLEVAAAEVPSGRGLARSVEAAIALHTLADAGVRVKPRALELYADRERLPIFARAFLLMALHRGDPGAPEVQTLTRELLGAIDELPGSAHVREPVDPRWDDFFTSDGRSDAIVLLALLRVTPAHPVIEKLARGLLERRRGGVWRNTQENAYALVALAEYARAREPAPPAIDARAWVADGNVLDVRVEGRGAPPRVASVDMAELLRLGRRGPVTFPVTVERRGEGRLYYRLAAEWAPSARDLPAIARGLTVTRRLRGARGPIDGAATVGEPLALDITLESDARVRYVAVDVPLPAGLEAVSRTLGKGRGASVLGDGQRASWVSHEEQRPDRVVLYADDLGPGVRTHTIDLRATARGRFQFPPTEAEAMYMPEVYGRSAGGGLEVR